MGQSSGAKRTTREGGVESMDNGCTGEREEEQEWRWKWKGRTGEGEKEGDK